MRSDKMWLQLSTRLLGSRKERRIQSKKAQHKEWVYKCDWFSSVVLRFNFVTAQTRYRVFYGKTSQTLSTNLNFTFTNLLPCSPAHSRVEFSKLESEARGLEGSTEVRVLLCHLPGRPWEHPEQSLAARNKTDARSALGKAKRTWERSGLRPGTPEASKEPRTYTLTQKLIKPNMRCSYCYSG